MTHDPSRAACMQAANDIIHDLEQRPRPVADPIAAIIRETVADPLESLAETFELLARVRLRRIAELEAERDRLRAALEQAELMVRCEGPPFCRHSIPCDNCDARRLIVAALAPRAAAGEERGG